MKVVSRLHGRRANPEHTGGFAAYFQPGIPNRERRDKFAGPELPVSGLERFLSLGNCLKAEVRASFFAQVDSFIQIP